MSEDEKELVTEEAAGDDFKAEMIANVKVFCVGLDEAHVEAYLNARNWDMIENHPKWKQHRTLDVKARILAAMTKAALNPLNAKMKKIVGKGEVPHL